MLNVIFIIGGCVIGWIVLPSVSWNSNQILFRIVFVCATCHLWLYKGRAKSRHSVWRVWWALLSSQPLTQCSLIFHKWWASINVPFTHQTTLYLPGHFNSVSLSPQSCRIEYYLKMKFLCFEIDFLPFFWRMFYICFGSVKIPCLGTSPDWILTQLRLC